MGFFDLEPLLQDRLLLQKVSSPHPRPEEWGELNENQNHVGGDCMSTFIEEELLPLPHHSEVPVVRMDLHRRL